MLREHPFFILQSGENCFIEPEHSWSFGGVTTFLYRIPYQPLSYFAICLNPEYEFEKDMTAVVLAKTRQDTEYFLGTLVPDRKTFFAQISETTPDTSNVSDILFYISIQSVSDVKLRYSGRKIDGPFTHLA